MSLKEFTFLIGQMLVIIGIGLWSIPWAMIYTGAVVTAGAINGMLRENV